MTASRISSAIVVVLAAFLAAWAIHADDTWFSIHWTHYACYLDDKTQHEAVAARIVAFVVAVLLVAFGRPLLARVSGGTWGRLFVAVGLSLVVCELALRWRASRQPPPPGGLPPHYMAHIGRQALDHPTGGRSVHYETDEHGYRVRDESMSVDLEKPSIVIAGESVAFGFGLQYDETIGAHLAKRFGLQDVNIAISGLSSASTAAHLEKELAKLRKPVAVVTFVVHTWLERETDRRGWHVDWRKPGDLEVVAPQPESSSPLRKLLGGVFLYRDDHRFEVARAAFAKITELARARDAVPMFVLTECGARCRSTEIIEHELTREMTAPWVAVTTPLAENVPDDMHPGPKSVLLYVSAIEQQLRENGVTPP